MTRTASGSIKALLPPWARRLIRSSARNRIPPPSLLTKGGKLRSLPPSVRSAGCCSVCGSRLTISWSGWVCEDVHCVGSPLVPVGEIHNRLREALRAPTVTRRRVSVEFLHQVMVESAYWRIIRPDLIPPHQTTPRSERRKTGTDASHSPTEE